MFRKTTVLLLVLFFLPMFLNAQNKALLKPGGKEAINLKSDQNPREVYYEVASKFKKEVQSKLLSKSVIANPNGEIDTMHNRDRVTTWNSRFGGNGQDILVGWFVAPTDLKIKSVGFATGDNDNNIDAEVKLYKLGNGWTVDMLKEPTVNLGYWVATGNGFNDIAPFTDEATEPLTWVAHTEGAVSPFAEDIWSDNGTGAPITPIANTDNRNDYQWIDMSLLSLEPEILKDEIFAIIFKINYQMDDVTRIGIWASDELGYGMLKYYANGRTVGDTSTAGWWQREFIFNMVASVEYTGDLPPIIANVTSLQTTLLAESRTVEANITDINPSGGTAGIKSAVLQYSTDGTTFTDVNMTASGDIYSAVIPGQSAGTTVTYKILATDVNDNITETDPASYLVFQKENNVLFLYNVNDFSKAVARHYYLGAGTAEPVDHDFWSLRNDGVSEVTSAMALYDYIIQVDGSYPTYTTSSAIKTWLDGATSSNKRAYFISSQDYGCAITGGSCSDTTFAAGDVEYDYFGIAGLTNQDFSGGNNTVMEIVGVGGDPVSGWVEQAKQDSGVTFWYDPDYETGLTNWIDNIDVVSGGNAVAIFSEQATGNVVGVRNNNENWYTGFISFDYLSNNFRSDTSLAQDEDPKYMWGIKVKNMASEFLSWTGFTTDVASESNQPNKYSLAQNYPNPFNPSTLIKFSTPQAGNVSLKIYDMLGREVAVLVNGFKNSGAHEVNFNASNLATGMYIYTIKAGDFTSSKKMMLLK